MNWWGLHPDPTVERLLGAVVLNLVLGGLAFARGAVSRSGFVGGVVVGTWILWFGGGGAYVMLWAFFVVGTGATRLGYQRKAAQGLAQEEGGRRGTRHAVANCGTGVLLATVMPFTDAFWPALGLIAAFATAASDTLGSEIGQLYGKRPIDPTTFRPVPPGTEGAVSVEGTVAGVVGSVVLAAVGGALGMIPWSALWIPVAGAFVGTTVESIVGAKWSGTKERVDNETMNFLNTVVGAGSAILLWFAVRVLAG